MSDWDLSSEFGSEGSHHNHHNYNNHSNRDKISHSYPLTSPNSVEYVPTFNLDQIFSSNYHPTTNHTPQLISTRPPHIQTPAFVTPTSVSTAAAAHSNPLNNMRQYAAPPMTASFVHEFPRLKTASLSSSNNSSHAVYAKLNRERKKKYLKKLDQYRTFMKKRTEDYRRTLRSDMTEIEHLTEEVKALKEQLVQNSDLMKLIGNPKQRKR